MLSVPRSFVSRSCALMLCCLLPALSVHAQQDGIDGLVEHILHDVVDRTIDAAREEVLRTTGVDLSERGYDSKREHQPLPRDASGETHRELRQIHEEHGREIAMLENELHQKLERVKEEFELETAREDQPEKVREKRHKLEEKVQAAYAKFNEKVDAVNARSDEKRDRILSKESGRGRVEGRGRDEGQVLDDLKL